MFAPSAMITPRSAARVRAAASAPGAIEDQLVEDRRRRLDLVAVDRPGVVGALEDAAGHEEGDRLGVAAEAVDQRGQPDREPVDGPAAEAPLSRGGDAHDGLAIDRGRIAEPDRQHATAFDSPPAARAVA